MPTDYTDATGQLRLLISDVGDEPVLSDDQVGGFLALHGLTGDASGAPVPQVKRAAADALDAIATSEVLVSKVIRTRAGVSTDGAKVAQALRDHARSLRVQADEADAQAAVDADDGFAVAEFTPWPRPWSV